MFSFNSAEEAANWFNYYSYLLFAGAVVVALGTYGTIVAGKAKDRFSDERVAANEAETKRAVADSDAAKEGTARANERAAALEKEAEQLRAENLTLERTFAPRRWYGPLVGSHRGGATQAQLAQLMDLNAELRKFPKMTVAIQHVPDFEAEKLAMQIATYLVTAGWIPVFITPEQSGIAPLSMPDGVQIWTRKFHDDAWNAAEALSSSFSAEGIEGDTPNAKLHHDDPKERLFDDKDIRKDPPAGKVIVLIGERPGFSHLMGRIGNAYRSAHPNEK